MGNKNTQAEDSQTTAVIETVVASDKAAVTVASDGAAIIPTTSATAQDGENAKSQTNDASSHYSCWTFTLVNVLVIAAAWMLA